MEATSPDVVANSMRLWKLGADLLSHMYRISAANASYVGPVKETFAWMPPFDKLGFVFFKFNSGSVL